MNHALAAAMRALVKEYLILVTQLEQLQRQGLLSLQKLWFYIQPAMRTLDILASLGTCLPSRPRGRACPPTPGDVPALPREPRQARRVVWPEPTGRQVLVCGRKALEALPDRL